MTTEQSAKAAKRREIVSDPNNLVCTCPSKTCEWKGRCMECVAIHRYCKDHLPMCLQHLIKDMIEALAAICELVVIEKGGTPAVYQGCVCERNPKSE